MSITRNTALKAGVLIVLLAVFVLGLVNTPGVAKRVIPGIFWTTQEFVNERQYVYAERSLFAIRHTLAFLDELIESPEAMKAQGIDSEEARFATRKELAREQRATEKRDFLEYKLARVRKNMDAALQEVSE